MKTAMSRFPVHDELTAPEGSTAILQAALSGAGQLPNFLGVLSGAPAALRAYTRFRAELRHGHLGLATRERIALSVAERRGSQPGLALHTRTARDAGLGIDEVARARQFTSADARHAALLAFLQPLVTGGAQAPPHLHEEAREAGWTDEELLEAIAYAALEMFTAMVNVAGDVPVDGSAEESRLQAA